MVPVPARCWCGSQSTTSEPPLPRAEISGQDSSFSFLCLLSPLSCLKGTLIFQRLFWSLSGHPLHASHGIYGNVCSRWSLIP